MPFAVTDNGDYLGWIVGPGARETWPVGVWIHEKGVAEAFDMSFGPFLVAFEQGELRPRYMPDGVWRGVPLAFEALPQGR